MDRSHPFSEFEKHPAWRVLEASIEALIENQDMKETTAREYIVGFLCKSLVESGVVAQEGAQTEIAISATGQTRVSVELGRDEALVLMDWLARFNHGTPGAATPDAAEKRVLWDVEATLESKLVEPFNPRYAELLADARKRVLPTKK